VISVCAAISAACGVPTAFRFSRLARPLLKRSGGCRWATRTNNAQWRCQHLLVAASTCSSWRRWVRAASQDGRSPHWHAAARGPAPGFGDQDADQFDLLPESAIGCFFTPSRSKRSASAGLHRDQFQSGQTSAVHQQLMAGGTTRRNALNRRALASTEGTPAALASQHRCFRPQLRSSMMDADAGGFSRLKRACASQGKFIGR